MWLTFHLCISPENTCLNKNQQAKIILEIFWAILTQNTLLKSPGGILERPACSPGSMHPVLLWTALTFTQVPAPSTSSVFNSADTMVSDRGCLLWEHSLEPTLIPTAIPMSPTDTEQILSPSLERELWAFDCSFWPVHQWGHRKTKLNNFSNAIEKKQCYGED